ncbi:MAG: endonuclease III [Myxococcota bacterium]
MPRESAAERRRRAGRIVRRLARAYPEASCALRHVDAFELLIATVLSAQCTDKMVNRVTQALFARYPDAQAMAHADPGELEDLIKPTGFYRQKAKSLIGASRDIVENFGGRVPDTMEKLLTLRGVARKTANVVLGNAFGVPGLTVDTHMRRIHQRLGLTRHEDPVKIERDLMDLVPRRHWTLYSHQVIHHGRICCDARKPQCEACPLRPCCPWPDSREGRARTSSAGGRRRSAAGSASQPS